MAEEPEIPVVGQGTLIQQFKTILNDVWDKVNHQLMGTAWAGSGINSYMFETDTTILNDVWDSANHSLKIAGGSGSAGNLTGAVTSVGLATSLGSFSSANLLTALTNETGTGVAVFNTSPTFVTPVLGVASATKLSIGIVDSTYGLEVIGNSLSFFGTTMPESAVVSVQTDETNVTLSTGTAQGALLSRLSGITTASTGSTVNGGHVVGLKGQAIHAGSGTLFNGVGLEGAVQNSGAGILTYATGVMGYFQGNTVGSTITLWTAFRSQSSQANSGTITKWVDFYSEDMLTGGSGTITARYTLLNEDPLKILQTAGAIKALTVAVRDTTAAFDVVIGATSSATLTADRILTLGMGNVAHTINLGTTANTITFPNVASGTVAMLNASNTWTTFATFQSVLYMTSAASVQGSAVGTGIKIQGNFTTQAGYGTTLQDASTSFSATSGAQGSLNSVNTFNPTSGTATYIDVLINPTINQTGGASGATAALVIAPVLTAAAAFTPIDIQLALVAGGRLAAKLATSGPQIVVGSGAPSLSASQGSIYLRSDGSTGITRAYINTDGGTTWTAITTVA